MKVEATVWTAIECPYCKAKPGDPCHTADGGFLAKGHASRREAVAPKRLVEIADQLTAESQDPEVKPKKGPFAGRAKLPYLVRCKPLVWCDKHGEVHRAYNVYKNGNCGPLFWRRVYVESDDKNEKL